MSNLNFLYWYTQTNKYFFSKQIESAKYTVCSQMRYFCSNKNVQRDLMYNNSQRQRRREREKEREAEGERELRGLIFSKSETTHQLQSRIVDAHIGISSGDTSYISATYWVCEQIWIAIFQFLNYDNGIYGTICLNYGRIMITQRGKKKEKRRENANINLSSTSSVFPCWKRHKRSRIYAHPSFPPSLFLFPIGSRIIESKAEATYWDNMKINIDFTTRRPSS